MHVFQLLSLKIVLTVKNEMIMFVNLMGTWPRLLMSKRHCVHHALLSSVSVSLTDMTEKCHISGICRSCMQKLSQHSTAQRMLLRFLLEGALSPVLSLCDMAVHFEYYLVQDFKSITLL